MRVYHLPRGNSCREVSEETVENDANKKVPEVISGTFSNRMSY